MKEQKVKVIENGTVIDHIPQGRSLKVYQILNPIAQTSLIAINVESTKLGSKDILKIEDRFLSPDETNAIALMAPQATINIIKDSKVVEKRKVELPLKLVGIGRCPNPNCICNDKDELTKSRFLKKGKAYTCYYCERDSPPTDLV